jgi:hypothetical protein
VWVDLHRRYGDPDDNTVGADGAPPGGHLNAAAASPGVLKR